MTDINFWIGAGVGLVSALVGAWVQFKFRIKEHEYKREQERMDREKEEQAREEAEKEKLIALISDLRNDIGISDEWKRIIERRSELRHQSGLYGSSVLEWYDSGHYRGRFRDEFLRKVDIHELKSLHMQITNMHSLLTASEIFTVREQRIEQKMYEMYEIVRRLEARLPQPDKENSQKE
jgi:hypothetical protein